MKLFSYRFSVRDDREPVFFMLSIIAILQTKNHETKISNRDGGKSLAYNQ